MAPNIVLIQGCFRGRKLKIVKLPLNWCLLIDAVSPQAHTN